MVHQYEGVIRLRNRQSFLAEIERRQMSVLQIILLQLVLQTLEKKLVISIRDFQMSMDALRHL